MRTPPTVQTKSPAKFRLNDISTWLRVAQPGRDTAMLSSKHVYILPSRFGWLYLLLLLAMLLGSINFSLSLGFVLTFLLAGMGNMAMLHTWRNLAYLQVQGHRSEPVFAGQDAQFEISIRDHKPRARYALAVHFYRAKRQSQDKRQQGKTQPAADAAYFSADTAAYTDVPALGTSIVKLAMPTQQRGWLQAGRISLFSEFPLSLFRAWAYVHLNNPPLRCLVYPQPSPPGLALPLSADPSGAGSVAAHSGDEDFAGHRHYQHGDSPRRIDWKASSREQGMLTKQFQGEAQGALWLDWGMAPGSGIEQRISQLTRWVMDAHAVRQRYGLRLPQLLIAAESGEQHYRRCLEALALFEVDERGDVSIA